MAEKKIDRSFYAGFALAVAWLVRERDWPSVAHDLMKSNGISIEDLRRAKVDGYDLRPIGKMWRDEERP